MRDATIVAGIKVEHTCTTYIFFHVAARSMITQLPHTTGGPDGGPHGSSHRGPQGSPHGSPHVSPNGGPHGGTLRRHIKYGPIGELEWSTGSKG